MSNWYPLSDHESRDLFTALVLEIFQLNGLLMARGNEISGKHDLTSALWHVLGALSQGPLTQAGIARRMGLTRQSVRRSTQLLLERELVESLPNPNHKRAQLIQLTEQGRRSLDAVLADWHRIVPRFYEDIPPEQLKLARDVLRTLSARMHLSDQGD